MKHLAVRNFGPIAQADIATGDLTVLVGPQATGKSVLLQLLKLIVDKKHIRKVLNQYGYVWSAEPSENFELYFGEGMGKIWGSATSVKFNGKYFEQTAFKKRQKESFTSAKERIFYVPAQRVVCLANGWPRFFSDYDLSVPFVLKHFSETLRRQLEQSGGKGEKNKNIFPIAKRLKEPIRKSISSALYHNASIISDTEGGKKKLLLNAGNARIPFMAWSAGQKEFMPLLLSLYWLSPPAKVSLKEEITTVVIEEPEMGLHPDAIKSVLLQIIYLLHRGYKVIVSTHSHVLLEFVWAVNSLKGTTKAAKALSELFHLDSPMIDMFTDLIKHKTIKTFFFNNTPKGSITKDISSLDVGDPDNEISDWGGVSEFSGRVSDIVSEYVGG